MSLRNRSNQGRASGLSKTGSVKQHKTFNTASNGSLKLNNWSTSEDALTMFNGIKAELADQINTLA